ncbi:MAG TPA: NADH-quinone oxidoreductase subunit K, partial [Polyangiaceae bacterium]|nr:NADH-quinone oxidoreductase subunit K [Polyangiaceae bacterium]
MEHWIAILIGVLTATGSYLVLRRDPLRMVLGFALLGTGANLLLLTVGRITPGRAPIVPTELTSLEAPFANPLSQALVLTAIVIGFGVAAYLMALTRATRDEAGANPPA